MVQFKKVLVPVDYSDYSRETLRRAAALCRTTSGEIVVLHVVEPIVPTAAFIAPIGGFPDPQIERLEGARAYLDSLHPILHGVVHEWFIRTGQPGEEILACAAATGVDLIVMATHGRSGLSRLLLGSTAEMVVRQACVPVMTYRAAILKAPQPDVEVAHASPAHQRRARAHLSELLGDLINDYMGHQTGTRNARVS